MLYRSVFFRASEQPMTVWRRGRTRTAFNSLFLHFGEVVKCRKGIVTVLFFHVLCFLGLCILNNEIAAVVFFASQPWFHSVPAFSIHLTAESVSIRPQTILIFHAWEKIRPSNTHNYWKKKFYIKSISISVHDSCVCAHSDGNAQCRMKTKAGSVHAAEIHFDRLSGGKRDIFSGKIKLQIGFRLSLRWPVLSCWHFTASSDWNVPWCCT